MFNEIYDNEIYNKKKYSKTLEENEGVLSLVDYYIKNPVDYNFRLFKLINPLFEPIIIDKQVLSLFSKKGLTTPKSILKKMNV